MGSGPRAGLAEIFLPELQKGSSIMPGKVNPVIPEVVTQVAAQVIGNDAAIAAGGMQGHFELNVFVPLMARNLLDSIELLASAARLFAEKCVDGIEANREACERYAELTLSAATALNPYIGYDKAAEIVKEAAASGRPLRESPRRRGGRGDARRGARLPPHGEAARRVARPRLLPACIGVGGLVGPKSPGKGREDEAPHSRRALDSARRFRRCASDARTCFYERRGPSPQAVGDAQEVSSSFVPRSLTTTEAMVVAQLNGKSIAERQGDANRKLTAAEKNAARAQLKAEQAGSSRGSRPWVEPFSPSSRAR